MSQSHRRLNLTLKSRLLTAERLHPVHHEVPFAQRLTVQAFQERVIEKTAQFTGDGVHDLILIDMRQLVKKRDWKQVRLGELIDFLEERIP